MRDILGSKAVGCEVDNSTEDCISRNSIGVAEGWRQLYKTKEKCAGQVYVFVTMHTVDEKKMVSQCKFLRV